MAPRPPAVDRFGQPILKKWEYPSPKPDTWDELVEQAKKDIRVLSPDAARQQRTFLSTLSDNSASKRADRLGSSKPKPPNAPPTNIRKRRLMLDD